MINAVIQSNNFMHNNYHFYNYNIYIIFNYYYMYLCIYLYIYIYIYIYICKNSLEYERTYLGWKEPKEHIAIVKRIHVKVPCRQF